MFSAQIQKAHEFSRCEVRNQTAGHGEPLSPDQKTDEATREAILHALWDDEILRTMDYHEFDVHVKNRVVYLDGHIVNSSGQNRIINAIETIPGVLEIRNNLILDDKLTLEVAALLGQLEHVYRCKFFTGASHGVVSINGIVDKENIKMLAEMCAASHPNVRGVINNLRVLGNDLQSPNQPFQQPTIGETIYFLDGVAGVVKQVILNPNNRRVIAMTVQGKPIDQQQETKSLADGTSQSQERLIVIRMSTVRYITRISGFLRIGSKERNRYLDFDPSRFIPPSNDWTPPYPYCSEDVLIPIKYKNVADTQAENEPQLLPFGAVLEDASVREQYFATDSFGL